ncbi:MAG: hemerythrin domain-containing protein [Alphaproteobacteria bacterium]
METNRGPDECGPDGPLLWSSAYELGVEALDADHRALVKLINRTCMTARTANRDAVLASLDALRALAAEHFAREEAVMAQIQLKSGAHVLEHSQLMRRLETLHKNLADNPCKADSLNVCEELIDWFVKHAVGRDAAIRAYYRGRD